MTRAATTEELAIYRSDGLAARLFAFIDQPVTVYQCQVNQVFTTHDKIAEVSYTGATGTLANALPGMTVLVGSTAGAHDKGLARLRKTWSGSVAYLGEMSEIAWETGLYLTVIDALAIWPRHLRMSEGSVWMDYDVVYSDQHANATPIPCLGPDRVLKLTGATVTSLLDASASWVPGSTISAYSWAVLRGPASLTNPTTATPTLTANDTGRILLACTVTAANGKSATGYRNVYVWDPDNPPTEVTLGDLTGSYERGGFEFSFELPIAPGFTVRDFTKVVLFVDEHPQSIGPVVGAENVLAVGWMDERACEVNGQGGTASISAKGAHYWLSRMQGFPSGIENVSGTPAAWTQIQGLTVDKMLAHFITWRTTLSNCCDFFPTADTRVAPALKAPVGTLWQQIKAIADDSILAAPMCDPCSRLFVQVDGNYLPVADRTGIPTVISLAKDDYSQVGFSQRSQDVSLADVSGVNSSGTPYLALSPGNVWARLGAPTIKDKLLIASQAQAESLAGLIFGREKREIESIEIGLVSPVRLITLAPRQYMELSVAAGDTPAGLAFDGRVLPREISIEHDATTGELRMSITSEPETFPAPAIKKEPPGNPGTIFLPPFPPLPPLPPPPPPDIPVDLDLSVRAVVLHSFGGVYVTFNIGDVDPVWYSLNGVLEGAPLLNSQINCISAHRFGNYLYVATPGTTYSAYIGDGVFSGLTQIYTVSQMAGDVGTSTEIRKYGLATNPVTGQTIEPAGKAAGGGVAELRCWKYAGGVNSGFGNFVPGGWGIDYTDYVRGIHFGQKIFIHGNSRGFASADGGANLSEIVYPAMGTGSIANSNSKRIGLSDNLFAWFNSGGGDRTGYYSSDNGVGWTMNTTPLNWNGQDTFSDRQSWRKNVFVDLDPTGAIALATVSGKKFYTSVDGGVTWTLALDPWPSGIEDKDELGQSCVVAVPNPDLFIAGANITAQTGTGDAAVRLGKIMISIDGGANWLDRTGNLYEIGAADLTPGVNNLGLQCNQIEYFYG